LKGLRQAAPYHHSSETAFLSGKGSQDLRLAAPSYHAPKTACSPSSATTLPGAAATAGKPASSSKKGGADDSLSDAVLSLAPGVEEDHQSVADSQIGAVSVTSSRANRAPRGKKGAAAASSKKGGNNDSSLDAASLA
jgi:hypothetical protein